MCRKEWMQGLWAFGVLLALGFPLTGDAGAQTGREEGARPEAAPSEDVPPPPPVPDLEAVPKPDLTGLESSVVEQLQEVNILIQGIRPQNGPEAAGKTFGEIAQVYHAYGFLDSAAACYRNATRLANREFHWFHLLGALEQQAGDLDAAAVAFVESLRRQPRYVATLVRLAEVELGRGELENARSLLERALELDGTAVAAQAALGELALVEGQYAEVVERLESVLAASPGANRFHYPLATAYRALGQVDKAREHLAQRGEVGVRPPDPLVDELQNLKQGERVYLLRGRKAFAAGRHAEAAVAFAEAVASRPESTRALVNLASALAQSGAPKAAAAALRRSLEIEPSNYTALFNLGQLLARDSPAEAVGLLRRAVALEPDDAEVRSALAALLRRGGLFSEALLHANSAVQLDPASEEARLAEVGVLAEMGKYKEALARLDAAQELMPTSGRVAFALARFLATAPDRSLRDGDRALGFALQVHQASASLEHAETVALALAQKGECEEAAKWQREVVKAAREVGSGRLGSLEADLARYEAGGECQPR